MGLITDTLYSRGKDNIKRLQNELEDLRIKYDAALQTLHKLENHPTRLVNHTLANAENKIRKQKSQRTHLRQLAKAYSRLFKDYVAKNIEAIEWQKKYFELRTEKTK